MAKHKATGTANILDNNRNVEKKCIVEELKTQHIVIGSDYCIGKQRIQQHKDFTMKDVRTSTTIMQ